MDTAEKLFRDDLSPAEIKSLTREELVLWTTRPRDDAMSVRKWMLVRVALLIAATLYYAYVYRMAAEQSPLLLFLFCYEFAYYNLRQEKAERDYSQDRALWFDRVKEFERNRSRE